MEKYICTVCGYVYDSTSPKWEDLPDDWVCPLCGASKDEFEEVKEEAKNVSSPVPTYHEDDSEIELSTSELAALCSNLAKGCEKQYLAKEANLFNELASYYEERTPNKEKADIGTLLDLIERDLNEGYAYANEIAKSEHDRGAQRALVWGEKVSKILKSLLSRYEKDGDSIIEKTNVYVCEICGFVYVGDSLPEVCPVCKVPNWKFTKIERR